ncbi:MAG: peptidoglycan-associated lipoprotein Pal, partial [Desulfococcaceae bacterium]
TTTETPREDTGLVQPMPAGPDDDSRVLERGRVGEDSRAMSEEDLAARRAFENERIYFGFDDATLTAEARRILRRKAEYLRRNPDLGLRIEGHCDERGTSEYNLALGDRRAESVKSFLVGLGISPNRLSTISYGEERPLDSASNEAAWALNRRAEFRLQ